MAETLADLVVEVHADMSKVKPEVEAGARRAGQSGGESLGDGITENAAKHIESDKGGRIEKSGKKSAEKFGKGFEGGLAGTFTKTAATMASKFTLIGVAAAAAAPGVLQLASALAPAAGLLTVLPAAMGAVKVATGVLKVAVLGVGEAITAGFGDDPKAATKALDGLSGSARTFAKEVIGLRGPINAIKSDIQGRFFLPLVNDVKPLASLYLPLMRKELGNIAGPLGGLGEQLAKSASSGQAFRAVQALLQNTGLTAVKLRGAIDPLIQAFAALISSTAPELPKLAGGLAAMATKVGAFIEEASKTGKVTAAFAAAKQVVGDLGSILYNVGSVVVSVYKASSSAGNNLLGNLKAITGQAAAFFQSAQGAGALTSVFGTLAALGGALRTGLGAVLPAVAESIKVLAPAVAGLAGPASQLIVALAPLLPLVAGMTAAIIHGLTPAISALAGYLTRNETVVKVLATALLIGVGAFKAYQLWTVASTTATTVWAIATGVGGAAAAEASVGVTLLGGALKVAMGPIGIVIGALTLLGAGLVLLYKHNETFRNFVNAAWKEIQVVVAGVVSWFQNTAAPVLKKVWDVIAAGATWLWKNILVPSFNGIAAVVKLTIAIVSAEIRAINAVFRNVIAPTVTWLWKTVVVPSFKGVSAAVELAIAIVKFHLNAMVGVFKNVVAPAVTWLWKNIVKPSFDSIAGATKAMWDFVRPILAALGDFVEKRLVKSFQAAVGGIKKAWSLVQDAAKIPVTFVVRNVINPLIGGFNKLAGAFGTTKIEPIGGFAKGGRIPGAGSAVDDRMGSLVDKRGKLLGAITVASGEFIVNAKDTARALPLLKWINAGMKGGPMSAAARIGRPMAERPGDGSEGWAFAKGGLVGFLDNIWDTISDPAKAITGPVNSLLGKIPGSGMLKDVLVGMGKKLSSGLVSWLGSNSGSTNLGTGTISAGGNLGKAMRFVAAQNGKPYVWASAGPGGYDCSGIVSAAWNILHGRSPYQHTFSTESLPGSFFPKSGPGGLLTAGWAHPGQKGASANVGHMGGQFVGGMSFESTGSRGVHINSGRRPSDFAHQGHFAGGGIAQVARADFGSVTLRRGWNMIENATGAPEPLSTGNDDVIALLRQLIEVTAANPAGYARAMGGTSTGLLREARRR